MRKKLSLNKQTNKIMSSALHVSETFGPIRQIKILTLEREAEK